MTPKLWFIKNMTHEAAGLFSAFADHEKIPYSIVDLHRGESFPEVLPGQAVVILGGPDSANDTTPKILGELEALRGCLREGVPCLGICLGLQLLVKAAGGVVLRHPVKEIGFRDPDGGCFQMERTKDGRSDPLLNGIADIFQVFQLHGETVSLTSSMQCLATGRFCKNQVVKIQDRVYGIQGHVELSEQMFRDWMNEDADLTRMDATGLYRDFEMSRGSLERSSKVIFKNFLSISGFLR